jgi:hypothetical protein
MELKVVRKTFTQESTIGELYVNDVFQCFIIEDVDRGLDSKMSVEEINKKKVFAKTSIPTGRYEIAITYSNRFQKYLPLLLNVPGFEGVRIHPGNTSADTEGCLLPGVEKSKDFVGQSKAAFASLFAKLKAIEKKEKIFITITK